LASHLLRIDANFKNTHNPKMSIYKIVAFVLIFIIIISSIGGVLFLGFGTVNNNITMQTAQKVKLEFETLELAVTDQERQIGYMNRESICTKCGMLFIFENQQPLSFWMKNTLVPLKITFIDQQGRVLNAGIGQPKVINPSVNSAGPAKYVLEVPMDSPIDLTPGQEIDIQEMILKGVSHTTFSKN
jgi:uncharacterized membrane protein (UPF0127 family)